MSPDSTVSGSRQIQMPVFMLTLLPATQAAMSTCHASELRVLWCGRLSGPGALGEPRAPPSLRKLTCFLLLGQSLGLLSEVIQRPEPFSVPLVSSPYPDPKDLSEELFRG